MINPLKKKLQKGEPALGFWVTIPSPDVSEALSLLDVDWLLFDMEHSPMNPQNAQIGMQGMKGDRATPIVRVAWNDQVLIKRALDIGSYGIVIPMVNTAEDARKAVAACKYPPKGIRGCGPRRPSLYDSEYRETADDEILILVQIETLEAVENVDEICAVEGVDGVFMGPMDLSFSMGLRGSFDNADFQKAADTILASAKRHKKVSGLWLGAGHTLNERVKEGWQFIGVGIDVGFVQDGANAALKAARG